MCNVSHEIQSNPVEKPNAREAERVKHKRKYKNTFEMGSAQRQKNEKQSNKNSYQ